MDTRHPPQLQTLGRLLSPCQLLTRALTKGEVFNANLHKEFFDAHRFSDLGEIRQKLATHLHWYDHARTHHVLGGLLVPADRDYGRVDEVLARIEAGAGRDVADLLDLCKRADSSSS
jgi:integrase-like protein